MGRKRGSSSAVVPTPVTGRRIKSHLPSLAWMLTQSLHFQMTNSDVQREKYIFFLPWLNLTSHSAQWWNFNQVKGVISKVVVFFSVISGLSSAVAGCRCRYPRWHQGLGLGQHDGGRTPALPASASPRWARQLISKLPPVPGGWTNTSPSHQEFALSPDPPPAPLSFPQGLGELLDAPGTLGDHRSQELTGCLLRRLVLAGHFRTCPSLVQWCCSVSPLQGLAEKGKVGRFLPFKPQTHLLSEPRPSPT